MTARTKIGAVGALVLVAAVIAFVWWGDMENKTEAQVNDLVQQHAEAIATTVGTELKNPSMNASGCRGRLGEHSDSIFSVQGAYNLDPAQGTTRLDTLAKVRADWQAKGYTITDDRETGRDAGVLAAKTPNGFALDLESTSGRGFAVIIHSACFERP